MRLWNPRCWDACVRGRANHLLRWQRKNGLLFRNFLFLVCLIFSFFYFKERKNSWSPETIKHGFSPPFFRSDCRARNCMHLLLQNSCGCQPILSFFSFFKIGLCFPNLSQLPFGFAIYARVLVFHCQWHLPKRKFTWKICCFEKL